MQVDADAFRLLFDHIQTKTTPSEAFVSAADGGKDKVSVFSGVRHASAQPRRHRFTCSLTVDGRSESHGRKQQIVLIIAADMSDLSRNITEKSSETIPEIIPTPRRVGLINLRLLPSLIRFLLNVSTALSFIAHL